MTRSVRHIEEVLAAVGAYWRKHPELRLCQILVNVAGDTDPFYVEDADVVNALSEREEAVA